MPTLRLRVRVRPRPVWAVGPGRRLGLRDGGHQVARPHRLLGERARAPPGRLVDPRPVPAGERGRAVPARRVTARRVGLGGGRLYPDVRRAPPAPDLARPAARARKLMAEGAYRLRG